MASSPSGWSLTALNAQTGAIRWKLPTAGMIGRPVIANGVVYFAPQDGYIYAVDAVTGQKRWRFQRTVNVSMQVGVDGYPALDGDTLYVASDGGAVYAFDAQTGKERWFSLCPIARGISTRASGGRGKVYVSCGNGTNAFYALDEATGKIVWQVSAPKGFDSYPLLARNRVYAGANGYYQASLYALDAQTGKMRWQFQANDSVITRPAFDGVISSSACSTPRSIRSTQCPASRLAYHGRRSAEDLPRYPQERRLWWPMASSMSAARAG